MNKKIKDKYKKAKRKAFFISGNFFLIAILLIPMTVFALNERSELIENAKTNRDKVADMMTLNQIEQAQRLAKEWMEKY